MPNPLPPTVESLEVRLGLPVGDLAGEDLERAKAALEDATDEALGIIPAATATAWTVDAPRIVSVVIRKAARREYENPQGFRQEGLGEHNATVETASGVYLTPDEVYKIKRAAGIVGFVGSVRTPSAYGDDGALGVYVPADVGGPILWGAG